ncbi:MAG: HipA domain-containing protein [Gammaproteobacteria bacterium]|nr:HipA domain-containing protein [Gammaproteobacteria bacterium]
MSTELEVRLGRQHCGHLVETAPRQWSFIYADDYRGNPDALPVSLALPRTRAVHGGATVHAVFSALLPDGSLRERLARSLGFSSGNDFALLGRVGHECHGALALAWPGETLRPMPSPRALDPAELRNAVAALLVNPLLAEADGLSKTLPGEFDKLPVRVADGEVSIVFGEESTTHVIKPARPGLRESVANEGFCMALAEAWGLPVAASEVLQGQLSLLAVRRVDRTPDGSARLHMEDCCQALGIAPAYKYEREGGPRLADIARLLRRASVQPALDLRALVRWVVFGFLIGAGAGHARQLALLYGPRGPSLAPFFGLWSTHVYPEMSFRLGFRVGTEDRPDWLTAARWREAAVDLGVRPRYLLDELRAAAAALPGLALEVGEAFQKRYGYADIIRSIRRLVEQRARQSLVSLEAERISDEIAVPAAIEAAATGANSDEQP